MQGCTFSGLKLVYYTSWGPNQKSFVAAESKNGSNEQTLALKNIPDEYLESLITEMYTYNFETKKYVIWEGYYEFRLLKMVRNGDSEFKDIKIGNRNTKVAVIQFGEIVSDGCGQLTMHADDDKWDVQCCFDFGFLVYSDSNCDITDVDGTIDVRLRKGWNKVYFCPYKTITTDDIKDDHLIWYNIAY